MFHSHSGTCTDKSAHRTDLDEPLFRSRCHSLSVNRAARHLAEAPVGDDVLVERARSGDESAFSAIYRRHAGYVAGIVYKVMGHDAELDDVVQETFVAAADGLQSLKEPARLRPWLATIAVRGVKRRIGARIRKRRLDHELGQIESLGADPRRSPEVDALYEALDELSDKLRIPWLLYRLQEEQLVDVAEMCGTSLATIKRRIAEADKLLKRKLDAE